MKISQKFLLFLTLFVLAAGCKKDPQTDPNVPVDPPAPEPVFELAAPAALTPDAGVTPWISDLAPTFRWQAIPGALRYDLQCWQKDIAAPDTIEVTVFDTAWASTVLLHDQAAYEWRVRARAIKVRSPWSAPGTFNVGAPPSPTAETATGTFKGTIYREQWNMGQPTVVTYLPGEYIVQAVQATHPNGTEYIELTCPGTPINFSAPVVIEENARIVASTYSVGNSNVVQQKEISYYFAQDSIQASTGTRTLSNSDTYYFSGKRQ